MIRGIGCGLDPRTRRGGVTLAAMVALAATVAPAGASAPEQSEVAKQVRSLAAEDATRIVTLGTLGGPRSHVERALSSNLLQVGDRLYLIDAGPGVSRVLAKAGFQPADINKLFLTHLHFDHVAGLGSFLGLSWLRRTGRLTEIFGPPSTGDVIAGAAQFLKVPTEVFMAQMPPNPPVSEILKVHDIDVVEPTVIYRDDKVTVTAVENSHFVTIPVESRPPGARRAYSYRFDTPDRSIVFTGDTGPSAAVEKLAKGADVLVSEVLDVDTVIAMQAELLNAPLEELEASAAHMREEHLTPEAVGQMAQRAGVEMVVLSHIGPANDGETDMRKYSQGVRNHFTGQVVVANDGQEF